MPTPNEGFAAWACDPRRSLEERFGAELLIEQNLDRWKRKHGLKVEDSNYTAEQLRKKERSLNPAHNPRYSRDAAAHVEEILPEVKGFDNGHDDDRPLRDLSCLRFCSGLESVNLRRAEIRDYSPLLAHPTLTKLDLWDSVARDLRVIGQLARLQDLKLWLGAPWPDLTGLENLVELREFRFFGNVLALRDIPSLPQVRDLHLSYGYGFNVPLRSLADLPDLPELRRLYLENTAELHGIERYAKLLNLEIFGYYTDLAPLAQLPQLTHLKLSGGDYPTLAPLAKMPQLRRLVVCLEEPPDFTPLAEAPRLHEIKLEISHIVPPELGPINAMLPPWSDEFAVHPPRPLAPFKLSLRDGERRTESDSGGQPRDWGEDQEMGNSEHVWFVREVNRRLTALLGKGWGAEKENFRWPPGHLHVTICRPEDLDRVPEVVQCLREVLATTRHPWCYGLIVDSLKYYERDMEEIYEAEGEEFDAEREREEWEYEQQKERERREFLERKYLFRLQQESGVPTKPEDFAPPSRQDEDGDIFTAGTEPEPSPYDLGTELHLYMTLTEKAGYIHERDRGLAEYFLGIKAEP